MDPKYQKYIEKIISKFSNDQTSEYGYRTDFEILLSEMFEKINVNEIEHDSKTKEGNKPDFIVTKNNVPILYIETKDIGVDLDKVESSGQMTRYYGYANLVLTDYLEFRFYRNGERYEEPILIGTYDKKTRIINPKPENFEHLQKTLIDFTLTHKEPIKSGFHLAKIMGGKAQRVRDNILQLFESNYKPTSDLSKIYENIKRLLIHDLSHGEFADMYAQTLVYGLFVARFYDKTPDNFTRSEARDLIPASNPLLRHFFDHITGPDLNKRLTFIVDELCDVFSHADVERLMDDYYSREKYGEDTRGPDPVIHFYEDFLKEYDPILRKKMGAYYTPQPVVQFIIRSVDQILKTDFGLYSGLSDTSKTAQEIHRVQVLDPATGTGTFYSAVIKHIYKDLKENNQLGRWPKYVHNDLLPRIHGFELMMAPYTIAHLKLSMEFKKTGFIYFNDRLGIYLTNSLEDVETQQDSFAFGFAESIAQESKEASTIKNDTPIMVIVGNPPYSGQSSNKGKWIMELMEDYKKEPGGIKKLNEKNPKWLNDDYVKFMRYAQNFIEKNRSGIVAYINPHGFLDNPTFRGMRWNLLKTYDKIYVLNLHGNAKKKEISPDGSKDENVFDIQQGVSINILVKTGKKAANELGKIYYTDVWGTRKSKFDYLNKIDLNEIDFIEVPCVSPMYFMVPKDFELEEEYMKGFRMNEFFNKYTLGFQTHRDHFAICKDRTELENKINVLLSDRTDIDILSDFYLKETESWKLHEVRIKLKKASTESLEKFKTKCAYRPFDYKWTLLNDLLVDRPRTLIVNSILDKNNVSLECPRQISKTSWHHILVADKPAESCYISNNTKEGNYSFPLYTYFNGIKISNLNQIILDSIKKNIGDTQLENLFYYIYAILFSSSYREKYYEFLKTDFPRIPYPTDRKIFDSLAKLGKELKELHLMESRSLSNVSLPFPETGNDKVENVSYKEQKVFINETQYFGNVSETTWNFYIGGYQPAQKWLKDRKGRSVSNEDIEHYQKIIFVLESTERIMKEIDGLIKDWPIK